MTEESIFCDENGKPLPRKNKFDMALYEAKAGIQEEEAKKAEIEWHENKCCCQDLQLAIKANNAWLKKDTALEEENEQLKAQIESMKETLEQIRWETNEHGTHNMAENELLKWGYIDGKTEIEKEADEYVRWR